jgi:hypothetical protein
MANRIGFTFDSPPTDQEVEVFEYFVRDYVQDNPGYSASSYVSYVGIYYSAKGAQSGIYVANSSTEQYG